MKHSNTYVTGWLQSSVHDFLEHLPLDSASTEFALITCLDSNPRPTSLLKSSPALKATLNGMKTLSGGLLFPSRILNAPDILDDLFVGFDEIWFFPSNEIGPKPQSVSIVGPSRIDQTVLGALRDWLAMNKCSLGLGDGCGLNIVVQATGIARKIIGHSVSQPQLSFTDQSWTRNAEEKSSAQIPFERHGKCEVALISMEDLLGRRFLHYSKIPGNEKQWALRDYANELILRGHSSPLTASQIEASVTHSEKAADRSVDKKQEWKMDCKRAVERYFGPQNIETARPSDAPDIGAWRRMRSHAS